MSSFNSSTFFTDAMADAADLSCYLTDDDLKQSAPFITQMAWPGMSAQMPTDEEMSKAFADDRSSPVGEQPRHRHHRVPQKTIPRIVQGQSLSQITVVIDLTGRTSPTDNTGCTSVIDLTADTDEAYGDAADIGDSVKKNPRLRPNTKFFMHQ